MKYTNKRGLSTAVMNAIISFAEEYDKVGWRSVTTLCDSPRYQLLMERNSDNIEVDVSDMIWMFIGNMAHHIAERSGGTDAIVEQRFLQPVDGKEISFKPDRLEKNIGSSPVTWTLRDFKVTSVFILKRAIRGDVKEEWERQMNLYVYLLGLAGFEVNKIALEILGRDWRQAEQRQSPHDYPSHQCHVVEVPVWTKERQEEFLLERIQVYKDAELLKSDDLPHCSQEERWATADRWAIVKKSGKPSKSSGWKDSLPRHSKYTSHTKAMEALAKFKEPKLPKSKNPKQATIDKAIATAVEKFESLEVEFRKGESKRCEEYCDAKPFCNQYHMFVNPPF